MAEIIGQIIFELGLFSKTYQLEDLFVHNSKTYQLQDLFVHNSETYQLQDLFVHNMPRRGQRSLSPSRSIGEVRQRMSTVADSSLNNVTNLRD